MGVHSEHSTALSDVSHIVKGTLGGRTCETGRNTMGVKLVNLETKDKLLAIAPVISQAAEEAVEEQNAITQ